jgi:protein TonB
VAIAIALHALVVAGLLAYEPARSALFGATPLMVDLIAPPKPEEPRKPPRVTPPKPKPVATREVVRPLEPPPVLTAPSEAPSPIVAPAPPPPAPPAPVAPVTAAPPAAPAPLTLPIFNADYLLNPPPPYPAASRRLGEQGKVILRVHVSAAGEADEVQVRTSSGYARLDDSARSTVLRWRFVPARLGSEPVAAWVLVPISFSL